MTYIRPTSNYSLSPDEKRDLLQKYFNHYREIAKTDPELLNAKLPRSAFDDLLHEIGELILAKADQLTSTQNEVKEFLTENRLPEQFGHYLPEKFRAYCLALNALKQWVSAEQAATDRYVFGGTVRTQCKSLGDSCLVSGTPADECTIELHHPVRDGRPPIPLAKEVHAGIEGQVSHGRKLEGPMGAIYPIKRAGNRSWVMLKLGCELLLDIANTSRSKNVQSSSKTFARKASEASGLNYRELLEWIETNNLA